MLKTFRALSLIEGLSLMTLLFVAMPARYYFGVSDLMFPVGMTHGILWLAYLVMSLTVSHKQGWSVAFWTMILLASVIPFACFVVDSKLKSELKLSKQSA